MLKLLACLFMLLDHIGFYFDSFLPPFLALLLRTFGRLAFPIFAWHVARGYIRSHNIFLYFTRLAVFAIISELIIRYSNQMAGVNIPGTNVLVTFALSVVLIAGYQIARFSWKDVVASLRPIAAADGTLPVKGVPETYNVRINLGGIELDPKIGLPLGTLVMFIAFLAAIWLRPDYEIYGMMTVLLIYIAIDKQDESNWEKRIWKFLIPLNIIFMAYRIIFYPQITAWAILQLFSLLSIPICIRHIRDKKPPVWAKYAFYLFYPLHIFALALIFSLIG